jgi:6-phosphogluconate dehydrogenase (decarboxylating)
MDNYKPGKQIEISGAIDPGYNGRWTVAEALSTCVPVSHLVRTSLPKKKGKRGAKMRRAWHRRFYEGPVTYTVFKIPHGAVE